MRKENEWKVLVTILAVTALIFLGFYKAFITDDVVDKIRRGEVVLVCIMKDGERAVPKEKVVNFDVDSLTWEFTNGSSKNCRTVDRGY